MIGVISEDENHNKIFKPMAGATLGQGVPLGAWCSFEKDVAPSNNWLMACTTFDATKYPALNLYLGTNKVPSRYDHNRPSEIQTLITRGTTVRPFTAEYDADITIELDSGESRYITVNGDNYELTSARATNSITLSVKKGDIVSCTGSSSITAWAIYGVYYSHPLFIKATSIASDTDQQAILAQIQAYNTYSTEETLTGKTWIDGKPIYRKCGNTESSGTWTGSGDYSLNLTWFKQSVIGNVTITKMKYHQNGKSGIDMRMATITANGVSFNYPYQSGLGYSPNDIIVFEYTKTTD